MVGRVPAAELSLPLSERMGGEIGSRDEAIRLVRTTLDAGGAGA